MLQWGEYLNSVIKSETVMDNMSLSYNGRIMHISPIVKASILMLEEMISKQGGHNVFVFPETNQFLKEFFLGKVIYNITAGKIQMFYDPGKFTKGQILKYEDCAAKFDHMEEEEGITRIYVRFADDHLYGVPIEIAPYFQVSEAKKLCTYIRFKKKYSAKNAIRAQNDKNREMNLLEKLENHKTHLNGSIFYVSSIKNSKEFLTSSELDGKKITDILYMAQVNGDGKLSNLSAGQLTGNPAIVLASDLYAVQNAIDNGVIPQSVIFDASMSNVVDRQLDAFDKLGRRGFPVVCVTNTANSFDLSGLSERGYTVWRWDSNTITEDLVLGEQSVANIHVKNCLHHHTEYLSVKDEHISDAVSLLYKQKTGIEDQSSKIISAYEKLFSLAFTMLRNVIPFETDDINAYCQVIDMCTTEIEDAKRFISPELYADLSKAAQSLLQALNKPYKNSKYDAICDLILSTQYRSVCIIIPEKADRIRQEKYWETLGLPCEIKVMYPMEYHDSSEYSFDIVIIAGWLGNKVMRQVIYGFAAPKYMTFTYPCEEKWKRAHIKIWEKALNNSGNGEVIKRVFSNRKRQISYRNSEHVDYEEPIVSSYDELDEIEQAIRKYKYKQYSNEAKKSEIVDAYPVSFAGGYLAFYSSNHKILVATDIISNNGNRIINKLPEELEVGDFVLIRESERDIIRDIADKLLEKNGKSDLRKLSNKWKESLSVELVFSTPKEIYQKLRLHGCKKNYDTVRNWISNENLIQPQDKNDILCIAEATGDDILREQLDQVFEAGREVRSTHISAGSILSSRLKRKIVEYIRNLGKIDIFNVWDPITLQLEEVGQVKILKVIDKNIAIPVDCGNTNRLLVE